MPVLVACTSCGAKLRAPDKAIGQTLKCPKCRNPMVVQFPTTQPIIESPTAQPPVATNYTPPVTTPVPIPILVPVPAPPPVPYVQEVGEKSCPFCGETVLAVAKKCKHCGESIGATPRASIRELRTYFEKRLDALANKLEGKGAKRASQRGTQKKQDPIATCLGCGCLAVLGIMLLTSCGGLFSSDHRGSNVTAELIEKSHRSGAEAGREEGRRAGEAEGFAASLDNAEKEAYSETIEDLYQSRQYQRIPLYTAGVMIGFFILGFTVQWIVFYVPRRAGYLRDIDWIVLPKEMTQVDLYDLSAPPPMESKRLKPPLGGTTLICLLILLPIIGCKSREEDAWQQGYEANRSAAYQEGWREAGPRGEKEGKERGKAEAEHAAQTGRAWHLYKTPAFLALMFGIIVGLAVQYTVLWCCHDAGRVPEMVTVAFVPAMKHSLAYSILESRRKLLIWWEQEKCHLAAANQLKAAQIQAVHDSIVRKLKVMTSLEELTQARLLDLAQQAMSKVVSDAEQKARTNGKRTLACPHCGKTIAYPRKKVGKFVTCPYANCGRPIHLPANADDS